MFIKFRPCDIITTTYKTFPSQTYVVLSGAADGEEYRSPYYYLDMDTQSSIGSSRDLLNSEGDLFTGSFNLSGAIELLRNDKLTNVQKRAVFRLKNIYASSSVVAPLNYSSSSIASASASDQYMSIINIPSILYGEEIKPNSFKLLIPSGPTLTDNGCGGILSNSVVIGSIFYQHGLIMLGHASETFDDLYNSSVLHFSGTNTIPMTMYICTAPKGMLNFSNNHSFVVENTSSNRYENTTKTNITFITAVGLYDEDYNLLGVAKVSKPILNKEDGSVQFRLKLNY